MKGTKLPEILHTALLSKKQGKKKKLFQKQKGVFGFVSLFVMFSLAFIPRPVNAAWWDDLIRALGETLAVFINIFVIVISGIINLILTIFVWLAKIILDFSISLSLNTSYTSGAIFDGGWPVLRDIANMGLILVLIAIGVGTMLNLKTNKKQLITFFIIALLINFTPVITGVIIDFSNIVASILYESAINTSSAFIASNPLGSLAEGFSEDIKQAVKGALDGNFSLGDFALSIKAFVSIILNIIIIFMFLFLAALFFARTLVLQVLVILSPLAFVLYISPSTRKQFNRWWKAFLQWSIIVIPMIFSLWLAGAFLNGADEYCSTAEIGETSGDLEVVLGDIASDESVCEMTAMMLAVGALLMGISLSFSSSAEGSKIIMKQAKKYSDKGRAYGKNLAGAPYRATREKTAPGIASRGQELAKSKWAQRRFTGKPLRGIANVMQNMLAEDIKEEKLAERKVANKTYEQLEPLSFDTSNLGRAARTRQAKLDPTKFAKKVKSNSKLQQLIETDKKRAEIRNDKSMDEFLKYLPHLADDIGKVISKMSNRDISEISEESLENPEVAKAIIESDKQTRNLMRELGKNPEKMRAYNVGLGRLVAQELGTTELAGGKGAMMPTKEEVREWLEEKKEAGTLTEYEAEIQNLPYFKVFYEYARQETPKERDIRIIQRAREEMEDEGYTKGEDKKNEGKENKEKNE